MNPRVTHQEGMRYIAEEMTVSISTPIIDSDVETCAGAVLRCDRVLIKIDGAPAVHIIKEQYPRNVDEVEQIRVIPHFAAALDVCRRIMGELRACNVPVMMPQRALKNLL